MSTNNKYNYKSLVGIGLKYLSKMSAIVQAYNRSPSGTGTVMPLMIKKRKKEKNRK